MQKFIISFLLIISLTILNCYASNAPEVSSQTAVIIDADTGQVLYSKDMNARMYPASTTKILTALIVLNKCSLNEMVTVGHNPPREDGTRIGLMEGEKLSVEDLLYSMLIESANDSALALAEYVSGTKEDFAILMNQTAKKIGCVNTNFVNPNGLTDDNHYTTAYDLAIIAKKAIENQTYKSILATINYQLKPSNMHPTPIGVYSKNKLLLNSFYHYKWATGGKSGYTTQALNTLVSYASKDGLNLIVVTLKAGPGVIYSDTINLFNYGFDNFSKQKVISHEIPITEITVDNQKIPIYPSNDFYITSLKNDKATWSKDICLLPILKTVQKNDIIGYLNIKTNYDVINNVPLIAGNNCELSTVSLTRHHFSITSLVKSIFFIFIIMILNIYLLKLLKKQASN